MMQPLRIPSPAAQMEVKDALGVAVAEATKMPMEDQNYNAYRIIEELAEEKKWADSLRSRRNSLTSWWRKQGKKWLWADDPWPNSLQYKQVHPSKP